MDWLTRFYVNRPWRSFLIVLVAVVILGMAGFLVAGYGNLKLGNNPWGKAVDAANYATQTITTVGYGNISFTNGDALPNADKRLKLFSSFYTVFSALVWVSMVHRAVGGR